MNHRRQENTLCSYAAMLEGLNKANPNHEVLLSLCEWGKTQPQNWGYKVGNSWRILNDITFQVGSDGNAGFGEWINPGTQSVTSQYNKAVIMDEFSGLEKGWNDPDMLEVGNGNLTIDENISHFSLWCMMCAPLILGNDVRKFIKEDGTVDTENKIYQILTNKTMIGINQDALGVQCRREKFGVCDVLVKPLEGSKIAVCVFNKGNKEATTRIDFKELSNLGYVNLPEKEYYKAYDVWDERHYDDVACVFATTKGHGVKVYIVE